MLEDKDGTDCCTIHFPGAGCVLPPESNPLVQVYDESRQVAFRVGLPIIGDTLSPVSRRLEEADKDELVEAADTIYLASCARLTIRETTRYEEGYIRLMKASGNAPSLLSGNAQLEQIRVERDAAMSSLLRTRERIARIKRLEAMAERTNSALEQAPVEKKRRTGVI